MDALNVVAEVCVLASLKRRAFYCIIEQATPVTPSVIWDTISDLIGNNVF